MKTLSEILIEVDKNPTAINKLHAWDQLMENKKKYPLVQLWFAKEYLENSKTVKTEYRFKDGVVPKGGESIISKRGEGITINEHNSIMFKLGNTGVNASKAGKDLRKAIESCMLNDKKDSFMVKIVKKLTKMIEKLNQTLNWFYKK